MNQVKIRNRGLNLGFPLGGRTNHLCHFLLSSTLHWQEVEPGLRSVHSDVGCGCHTQDLNYSAKGLLPWSVLLSACAGKGEIKKSTISETDSAVPWLCRKSAASLFFFFPDGYKSMKKKTPTHCVCSSLG